MTKALHSRPTAGLTDEEIICGLRNRDPQITRDYFYGICRIAYHIYRKRYNMDRKAGLDFYSIAHEYYLALDKYDFHQLEDRNPNISLKTWMINGFRFVLLDRLKAYKLEHRMESFEERMEKTNLHFDIPDDNFSEDFRNTVMEICNQVACHDRRSSLILEMILLEGFKGKEVAAQLGVTPSAVTQRYHKMMEQVIVPYFKHSQEARYSMMSTAGRREEAKPIEMEMFCMDTLIQKPMERDYSHRITPEYITTLQPNEIFVFGSNLAGMHGGGAARMARLHFGAVMGNGDGPQGQSYAIPTMQGGTDTIRPYVDKFIRYAVAHPEQTFLVTPIGCGIAGFEPEDIAPLFEDAVDVENIHLPESFWEQLV
jgi:RNA polymerase sigma factor (sigma-70 family)